MDAINGLTRVLTTDTRNNLADEGFELQTGDTQAEVVGSGRVDRVYNTSEETEVVPTGERMDELLANTEDGSFLTAFAELSDEEALAVIEDMTPEQLEAMYDELKDAGFEDVLEEYGITAEGIEAMGDEEAGLVNPDSSVEDAEGEIEDEPAEPTLMERAEKNHEKEDEMADIVVDKAMRDADRTERVNEANTQKSIREGFSTMMMNGVLAMMARAEKDSEKTLSKAER